MLHEAENRDEYECFFFERPYYLGLCSIIGKNLDVSDEHKGDNDIKYRRDLPELKAKETGNYSDGYYRYHFKNWGERIAALKKCIKETEPK